MMNIIETPAPIAIKDLKVYFANKDTTYLIDYDASTLKGEKLLVYLGNLDLPCDIKFESDEGAIELIQAYANTTFLVTIPTLEQLMVDLILQYNGCDIYNESRPFESLIVQLKPQLKEWTKKLMSCSLYNLYCIDSDEYKDYVKSFPEDDTASLEGINFLSLLKHDRIYRLYNNINQENLYYYSQYFNEYMFKGKNLYSYWANPNNPLFLLTWGIASGVVDNEEYVAAVEADAKVFSVEEAV